MTLHCFFFAVCGVMQNEIVQLPKDGMLSDGTWTRTICYSQNLHQCQEEHAAVIQLSLLVG